MMIGSVQELVYLARARTEQCLNAADEYGRGDRMYRGTLSFSPPLHAVLQWRCGNWRRNERSWHCRHNIVACVLWTSDQAYAVGTTEPDGEDGLDLRLFQ